MEFSLNAAFRRPDERGTHEFLIIKNHPLKSAKGWSKANTAELVLQLCYLPGVAQGSLTSEESVLLSKGRFWGSVPALPPSPPLPAGVTLGLVTLPQSVGCLLPCNSRGQRHPAGSSSGSGEGAQSSTKLGAGEGKIPSVENPTFKYKCSLVCVIRHQQREPSLEPQTPSFCCLFPWLFPCLQLSVSTPVI